VKFRDIPSTHIPVFILLMVFSALGLARGQSDSEQLNPILGEEILSPQVATFELKEYILQRIANPPSASSAEEWTAEANRLREYLLNEQVVHALGERSLGRLECTGGRNQVAGLVALAAPAKVATERYLEDAPKP